MGEGQHDLDHKHREADDLLDHKHPEADTTREQEKEVKEGGGGARSRQPARSKRCVSSSEDESSGSIESDSDLGFDSDGQENYEVDSIVDERVFQRRKQYQVFWKPRSQWPDPTWIDFSVLSAPELLQAWEVRKKQKK